MKRDDFNIGWFLFQCGWVMTIVTVLLSISHRLKTIIDLLEAAL